MVSLSSAELNHLFFALIVLLVCAHFFGYLFHRLTLPRVIGEIFGGLILGPTGLGYFFPGAYQWLFQGFEVQGKCLSLIFWLGLILLMFISGFDVKHHISKKDIKLISLLTFGSTVIPVILSLGIIQWIDLSFLMGPKQSMLALYIIAAIAVSVTSIPVISRIFIDLKIMDSYFAKIILSTSTIHDVILWVAFAVASTLVQIHDQSFYHIFLVAMSTILFFALSFLFISPIIQLISKSKFNMLRRASRAGYILIICLSFSAVANLLEINIIFGALLAGIVVGLLPYDMFEKEKNVIREIALAFFVPLYFAMVGLKLDLLRDFHIGLFLAFLLFSSFCQLVGTLLVTVSSNLKWIPRFNIFVALNTKGGPGIVLATAAYDLGIINAAFFVSLVLIAIVTSLGAGVWFRYVLSRQLPLLT